MRRLAIFPIALLAACGSPSNPQATLSPTARTTPLAISTACPAAGTARAAIRSPLTLGSLPVLIYGDVPEANGGPVLTNLMRYEVATGSKTQLLQASLTEAAVSPDGHWIALATTISGQFGLQLLRSDGRDLQTLFCATNENFRGLLWSTDQQSLLFTGALGSGAPTIYRLDLPTGALKTVLNINEANTEYFAQAWLDNDRAVLVGRPIGPAPGFTLQILDLSRGLNQQSTNLQRLTGSTGDCWDADTSGDTVYTSQCQGSFSDQGGGSTNGPSNITLSSATGGASHRVFNSPSLAVTQLRATTGGPLLLIVGNQSPTNAGTSMNGLWKVNTDGTGLTRLAAAPGKRGEFAFYNQVPWATVSKDNLMYAVAFNGFSKPPTSTVLVGPIAGGPSTTVASHADGGQVLVIGWTTS